MNTVTIIAVISEIVAVVGTLAPFFVLIKKLIEGERCQLRSDMLRIYYAHIETKTIRQYEYENFVKLYEAYKALKGNSFIDKIYKEVKTWQIVS
jgi:hypothetical protein